MSDLISRSESIEELEKYEKELQKDKVEAIETDDENMLFAITNQLTAICRIKRNIMNMPTAYDIDKVIEELEDRVNEANNNCLCEMHENGHTLDFENENGRIKGLKEAIEIVKQGGGVDE